MAKPMNPISSTFCVFLLLFIVLLVQRSSGSEYPYESCVEKQCDKGPGIKFPFYITGEQEPFCGFFVVYCGSNGTGYPMIRLSDNEYVITEISYEKLSFRVRNSAVDSIASSCLFDFRNVTTPQPSLSVVSSSSLHLLSKCVGKLPEQLDKYKVSCNNGTAGNWELAILGDDENLSYGIRDCEVDVVAPVELRSDEGRNGAVADFEGLLRRGFALNWTSRDCNVCEQSGGHCGIEPRTNGFRCYCSYGFEYTICQSRQKSTKTIIILVIAAVGVAVVSVVILVLCFITRKRLPWWIYCCMHNKLEDQQIENFLKNNYGSLAPKRFHYSDLKKITNSFDTKLGEGGYGSVYKGKLQDGRLVAVKVLKETKGNTNGQDFINEVESISRTSHVNIVTLLGFCFQGHNNKKALIYEFMTNGSLEKFIYGDNNCQGANNRQLGWPTLYRIAVGIARGLEYLHRGCNTRILHFDIKPQNILLDEDFCPKISDFGLAKLCQRRKDSIISLMDIARGTIGFIAPEMVYKNIGGVSHKSDVYSYGMMVLEMVGGRKNADSSVDRASQKYFPHWIYTRLIMNQEELCLSGIMNEEENKQVKKMLMVGFWCIQTNPSFRPTIGNVLEMLEGPLENIQMPPKPFLYSPSRTPSSSTEEEGSSPPDYLSFFGMRT